MGGERQILKDCLPAEGFSVVEDCTVVVVVVFAVGVGVTPAWHRLSPLMQVSQVSSTLEQSLYMRHTACGDLKG